MVIGHRGLFLKKVGRKALFPRILGTPPRGVDQILIFLIKNQYFWSFIFDVFQCLSTGLFGFQTFHLANTSFTMLIANLLLTLELTIQLNINMPLTISISRRGWALVKTKIRMVNVLYTIGQIDILENGHDTNTFLVLRMATHVPIVINLLIPLGKLDKLNCIQCICTV